MQKEKITLEVPPATARAYERATAPEKRRAESALSLALQTADGAADELESLLRRMRATAKERGMTEEALQALLEGDVNDDATGDE